MSGKRGRPAKDIEDGTRKSISFMVSPDTYRRLVSDAEAQGRSISDTAERALQGRHSADDLRTIIREEICAALAERDETFDRGLYLTRPAQSAQTQTYDRSALNGKQ